MLSKKVLLLFAVCCVALAAAQGNGGKGKGKGGKGGGMGRKANHSIFDDFVCANGKEPSYDYQFLPGDSLKMVCMTMIGLTCTKRTEQFTLLHSSATTPTST